MSTPVLSPVSMTSFYDPYTGAVLQASLYFYKSQTLDQISVWTDPITTVNHQQPVLTGGSGRVPPIWIKDEGYYRIRSFDQYGTLLEDIDGLPGAIPEVTDGGGGGGTPGDLPPADSALDKMLDWVTLQPGDIFASFSAGGTKRPGAVRCNGGTIGRGTEAGDPAPTEHSGIECKALYLWLWGQDALTPNNLLLMPAGKGSTSTGDWDAGRLLTLPDLRGRTIVGTDPMGNGAPTGRMTGARFEKAGEVITTGVGSDASVPGAGGGLAKHTLNLEQMPVHTHAITDPKHTHAGTTGGHNVDHTHVVDGYTDNDGTHEHTYDRLNTTGGQTFASGSLNRNNQNWATTGGGAHRHHMSFATGGSSTNHTHDFTTDAQLTNITITHAGGKGTSPTLPKDFVTQPFNLAQPFLTLTWYMSLGPPPVTP